ncbi:MAG: hypothetical protein ACYCY2_12935 [Acidithiobacillus ferriphilus]
MANTERVAAGRFRRRYTDSGYAGSRLSVMLSGQVHMALDDLMEHFRDKSQKAIVKAALMAHAKACTLRD